MGIAGTKPIHKKSSAAGKVTIGGKTFHARSTWESNIAAFFQWAKEQCLILDWEFEPKTFWFEGIKRGVMSYLPDFRTTEIGGSYTYWEVKGWWDPKSRTKVARMKKYHPDVKLEIIDEARYKGIAKWSSLYPEWGKLNEPAEITGQLCEVPDCNTVVKDRGLCKKHYLQVYGNR
jgi:hypothetical protein